MPWKTLRSRDFSTWFYFFPCFLFIFSCGIPKIDGSEDSDDGGDDANLVDDGVAGHWNGSFSSDGYDKETGLLQSAVPVDMRLYQDGSFAITFGEKADKSVTGRFKDYSDELVLEIVESTYTKFAKAGQTLIGTYKLVEDSRLQVKFGEKALYYLEREPTEGGEGEEEGSGEEEGAAAKSWRCTNTSGEQLTIALLEAEKSFDASYAASGRPQVARYRGTLQRFEGSDTDRYLLTVQQSSQSPFSIESIELSVLHVNRASAEPPSGEALMLITAGESAPTTVRKSFSCTPKV